MRRPVRGSGFLLRYATPLVPFTLLLLLALVQLFAFVQPLGAQESRAPGDIRQSRTLSVAEALQDADGDFLPDRLGENVQVEGVVISEPAWVSDSFSLANLQDRTGGVALVGHREFPLPELVDAGDTVRILGRLEQYQGQEQLDVQRLETLGSGPPPEPDEALAAQMRDEAYGGKLVRLEGRLEVTRENGELHEVRLRDRSGSVPLRIVGRFLENPAFAENLRDGMPAEVVGIVLQRDTVPPLDSGYYLLPRDASDVRFRPPPSYRTVAIVLLALLLGGAGLLLRRTRRRSREHERLAAELRRSREALAESEQRYRSLFEHNPHAIYGVDPEGRVIAANPAMEELTGFRAEDALGAPFDVFLAEEDRSEARQTFDEVLRDGARRYELRVVRPDGTRVEVRGVSAPVRVDGRVRAVYGTAEDVTERKRAEEALRESEERFRLMVEGSEEVFFYEHDADHRWTYLSPSVETVLGYRPEELLGRPYDEMLAESANAERVHERTEEALSRRESGGVYEALVTDRDGREVVLEVVERPVVREGEVVRMRGFARDITERRQTEEQLLQAQKMEAVGRLAGGVAHDFNNLLMAISGNTQLLLSGIAEDDPLRPEVEEIERATRRATNLTRQLLAFSRREARELVVVDANGIVSEMEVMLRRLIGRHVDLVTDLAPDAGAITSDPGQIQQVVMNLVVNARDTMPDGGTVEIETRNVELSEEDARTLGSPVEPGAYVRLSVCDSGPGIPEEIRDRIFEPFFTTKERGKGTGLGLSTAYGIVRQSGGTITARNQPEGGAAFDVFLPRRGGAPAPGRATADRLADEDASEGATILVVEDEDSVRVVVRKVLERRGHRVMEAEDGRAALDVLERGRGAIDLVLTDIAMPRMDGPAMAEELRRRYPNLPLLFMSGYAEEEGVRERIDVASNRILEKPFDTIELIRWVEETLVNVGE